MLRIDVVERLDHMTAQLLSNPLALGRASLDPSNTAVPLLWIVVAGIYDDDVVWNPGKQISWQFEYVLLGNRHDDHVSAASSFGDCDRGRTGLAGQACQRFGTS